MQNYKNSESLAIHLSHNCNLKCKHCYLQGKFCNDTISMPDIDDAIELINPKSIIFYGGEPMLHPKLIEDVMQSYPKKKFAVITNGTIDNPEIFDRIDTISISLSSFEFAKAKKFRPYSQYQFETVLNTLVKYNSKILIVHDIYPLDHDDKFIEIANNLHLDVDCYPLITETEAFKPFESYKKIFNNIPKEPLVFPKLRLLPNGVITRDMRGIHNLCHVTNFESSMRNIPLQISDKCKYCAYNDNCIAFKMFPAMVKDLIDSNPEKDFHFCKLGRFLSNANIF